jgi:hypothetical protein
MVKLTTAHSAEKRMPVNIWFAIVPPFQRARRIPPPTPEAALPYTPIISATLNPFIPPENMKGVTQIVMAGMHNTNQNGNHLNLRGVCVLAESSGGAGKFFPQNGHNGAE